MGIIRIAQAQINSVVGDFAHNKEKILKYINIAKDRGADMVVFPELSVCGYPPEDLLLKPGFLEANMQTVDELKRDVSGITAIVGYADRDNGDAYNAAAIIQDGEILGVYHKMELPNYGVFDEKRYFKEGTRCIALKLKDAFIVPTICEDIWIKGDMPERFSREIGADMILNISASPFYAGKFQLRIDIGRGFASRVGAPLFFTNLVGAQDELVFDGGSFVIDPAGDLISCARRFCEQLLFTDIEVKGKGKKDVKGTQFIELTDHTRHTQVSAHYYLADKLTPLEEIYHALVLGTRDYVIKNGFKKVLIGLSGGIDSSLVAVIAVDALGKENVIGVTMPSQYTSSETLGDAERLAKGLDIELIRLEIRPIYDAYLNILKKVFDTSVHTIAHENLQARIRGNLLMAISNRFGYLVLTTGNKSEIAVGYCTLYGDTAGGFAVIKDLPKMMVYELARYANLIWAREIIPESVINRAPSAELRPNQKDEDSLPPYPVLDRIIHAYVEEDKDIDQIIKQGLDPELVRDVIRMIDRNEYKRRQSPPGVKITSKAFGRDWKFPITNRYMRV